MRSEQGQRDAAEALRDEGIDGLVVIGGEGSMKASLALSRLGIPVVGVPGTIDNDVWGTDETIGFDTCLNTILDAVSRIRDTASAHDRVFVVEVMGRESGELAVSSAVAGGADLVLVPEVEIDHHTATNAVRYDHERGKLHTIIIVAEGCCRGEDVVKELQPYAVGHDVRLSVLGYLQRGGRPTARDRILGSRLGAAAAKALLEGRRGVMVGAEGLKIVYPALADVTEGRKPLRLDLVELVRTLAI
jgi:6-phosphofructokinase 1